MLTLVMSWACHFSDEHASLKTHQGELVSILSYDVKKGYF